MSRENVEVVKRLWEASLRQDNDAVFDLYDPEVEIVVSFLDSGPYHGIDGAREWYRNQLAAFTDLTSTVEEWIDAGDDVILDIRVRARGRSSGVPLESRQAHVWTVRNGKLRRLRVYQTREEALKAVGLAE